MSTAFQIAKTKDGFMHFQLQLQMCLLAGLVVFFCNFCHKDDLPQAQIISFCMLNFNVQTFIFKINGLVEKRLSLPASFHLQVWSNPQTYHIQIDVSGRDDLRNWHSLCWDHPMAWKHKLDIRLLHYCLYVQSNNVGQRTRKLNQQVHSRGIERLIYLVDLLWEIVSLEQLA